MQADQSPNRRDLMKGLAGVTLGGSLAIEGAVAATPTDPSTMWSKEADVIVVGTGVAATSAAIAAAGKGASVLMLEKMPFKGGTTAKSAGVFWIPNNPILRSKGIVDDRMDALRYMARLGYPIQFVTDHPTLGVPQAVFDLLCAYYDNATIVVEKLMAATGLKIMPWLYADDALWPDYFGHLPIDKVSAGRSLVCDVKEHPDRVIWSGGGGAGVSLLWQLEQGMHTLPIETLLEHRVRGVTQNAAGEVTGVVVETDQGGIANMRAKRGVIFATGGFTHNVAMAENFLRGPIWGGCAAAGSTGDFVGIAAGVGAMLGNMNNAWWAQVSVERAIKTRSVPSNVWLPPGDSMIQVNASGMRFANEKSPYNERAQLHFAWDPINLKYPNLLGFMIWDSRTAKLYGGYDPVPPPGTTPEHVVEAASLEELKVKLDERLKRIAARTGGVKLDSDFLQNLKATISRYNEFAKAGKDTDFRRGESPNERAWQFWGIKPVKNPYGNLTMYPIAETGPYYALIVGAGTLDTKGGPMANAKGQVLNQSGKSIPGLYGAGNCVASVAGQGYWGGGGTIGPAMTFGYLSGIEAASEPAKGA
jgi:succinate dehydrogenase/fumarate reductase flavoprotein subunit